MFIRFPEIVPGYQKNQTLIFGDIPYAFFSIQKTEGRKTVFLTEHTLLFTVPFWAFGLFLEHFNLFKADDL
jgi:hypothetical protein